MTRGDPMKSLSKLLVAIVLAGAMSSASATLLTFGINLIGSVTLDTPNISAATTTKFIPTADLVSSCAGAVGACAAAGIVAGGAATFSTGTLNTFVGPDAFTISAGSQVYSFSNVVLATIVASTATSAGSISLQFDGFVTTDPTGLFLGQTVTLSQSCTQASTGAIITCNESVITPGIPVETPEPMSLALVGMGLVALGFIRRKRA
jgi:hypothetical protein